MRTMKHRCLEKSDSDGVAAAGSNANVGSVSMVDGCVCYAALRQHVYLLEGVKVNSAAIWKKTIFENQ